MITVKNLKLTLDDQNVLENCNINFGCQLYIISGNLYKRKSLLLETLAHGYRFYNPQIKYYDETGVIYLPNQNILLDNLTVLQNLEYYQSIFKSSKSDVALIIDRFKLNPILNRKVNNLVKEHRQLVRISCALLNNKASVLILDDPFIDLSNSEILIVKNYFKEIQFLKTIIIGQTTLHHLEDLHPREIEFKKEGLEVRK